MPMLSRRAFVGMLGSGSLLLASGLLLRNADAAAPVIAVHKSPTCGCCGAWVEHMRRNGFDVRVTETEDLSPLKRRLGVPDDLQSCHTAVVDGFVIEGHVPAADVKRLLASRPNALGLAVPGMPIGSPGMEQGNRREAYQVILFAQSTRQVFAQYR